MKNLIIKYLLYLLLVGTVISGIIFGVSKLKENYISKKVQERYINDFRIHIVDSVSTLETAKKVAEMEAVQAKNADSIKVIQGEKAYWKKIAVSRKVSSDYNRRLADSLLKAKPECTEIANHYRLENDSLREENNALDKENEKLDAEAELYSTNWYVCRAETDTLKSELERKNKIISTQYNDILFYKKKADEKPKFSTGFKTGFVFGYVAGAGTVIMIKK